MIKPHGADQLTPLYIEDKQAAKELVEQASAFPQVLVSSATAANAVMLGGGYFTPLTGYMNKADVLSVAENMTTDSGVFFPVPVTNLLESVEGISVGEKIALLDPNVETVSAIEELTEAELKAVTEKVYATTDPEHPGVAAFNSQGRFVVSGSIEVLNFSYFETDFPATFRTAVQIREEIEKAGWKKTVAFQTRNPMHRAHEELCTRLKQMAVLSTCF